MANYSPRWFSVTVEQDRVGQHPLHLPLEDDGVGDDATRVVPGLGPDRFLSMTYIGLVRHTHETGGIL